MKSLLLLLMLSVHASAVARPNFVFIVADDMRPDAIGAFGHPVVKTPNLDRLVREGTVFARAITGYPICHVSRAEFLTGRCAFQTGVHYRGKALGASLSLWPDTLRQAGYRTWFSGKWHNDGQPRRRGFEETGGLFSSGGAKGHPGLPDYAGRKATGYTGWTFKTDDGRVELDKGVGLTPDTDRFIAEGAIELIKRKRSEPFFLMISFTGPHDPLIWPRGYEGRFEAAKMQVPRNFAPRHLFNHGNEGGRDEAIVPPPRNEQQLRAELAVYCAVISNIDEQVGRIVTALREVGAWENTVLIFTSDHGLALGSHGLMGKQNQYEHTIGVPFIMRGPGIPQGQSLKAQCYLRDLFPTTCELAGIAIPASVQSRSLAPVLSGKIASIYPEVYGCFTDTQRMIRDERWKLIWYPKIQRYQLFDLVNDPDELTDLSSDSMQSDRLAALKGKLETWLKRNGDPLWDAK